MFQYTSDEIKWYGYSLSDAIKLLQKQMEIEEREKIIPLKHIYRAELVDKLKAEAAKDLTENVEIE